jgi:hypothetical protein
MKPFSLPSIFGFAGAICVACSGTTSIASRAVADDAASGSGGSQDAAPASGESKDAAPSIPSDAAGDAASSPPIPFSQRVVRSGFGRPVNPCSTDPDCPSAEVCFRLTDEVGFCDAAQPVEATTCNSQQSYVPADECGCGGLQCDADQLCVAEDYFCSCAPMRFNVCVDTACRSPADCPNAVCRPSSFILGVGASGETGRCIVPRCRSDRDCTLAPNGWCAVFIWDPSQQGESNLNAIDCVYPIVDGKCPPGTATNNGTPCRVQ